MEHISTIATKYNITYTGQDFLHVYFVWEGT